MRCRVRNVILCQVKLNKANTFPTASLCIDSSMRRPDGIPLELSDLLQKHGIQNSQNASCEEVGELLAMRARAQMTSYLNVLSSRLDCVPHAESMRQLRDNQVRQLLQILDQADV